jgi:hypothetical protein
MNSAGKHILMAVAGAIGSNLALLPASLDCVGKLTIIDFDKYEPENILS